MLYIVSFSAIAIFPLSLSVSVSLLRTLSNDVTTKKLCDQLQNNKKKRLYSEEILFLPACVRVCQENLMRETNTRCLSY